LPIYLSRYLHNTSQIVLTEIQLHVEIGEA
jgi:hypothetical protein